MSDVKKRQFGIIHISDFDNNERLFVESITDIIDGAFIDNPRGRRGFGVYATNTEAWIKFWRLY